MKPFHIAGGIASAALLIVGAMAIRSKLDYDKEGREITRLIGEFKAIGVPTNGEELFHPIPDSENAWVEIGPILMDKNGLGNGPLFRSGLASDLLAVTTKQDLPLIRKYLKFNQAKREAITAGLKAKPKIQVPHNYNEGLMMLLPEFATMKAVGRDFCLAAYADALEGNLIGFQQNLEVANRFANHCTDRKELIGVLVGISIHREIMNTALRLAEISPDLIPQIQAYMAKPNLMHISDPKQLFQGEFVMQIASGRFLDTPLADRKPPPWPLNKIVKQSDSSEIESRGKVRSGDYMPKSHGMRTFLRKRLETWKPVLTELMAQKEVKSLPPRPLVVHALDMIPDLPPAYNLSFDGFATGDFDTYRNYSLDRQNIDVNLNLWRAIDIKKKTGKYPASLKQIGIPIRSITGNSDYVLRVVKAGILIESVEISKDTGKPIFRRSFPVSLTVEPKYMDSHLKKVQEYRSGKIDETGSAPRGARIVPPPGAPPLAPSPGP